MALCNGTVNTRNEFYMKFGSTKAHIINIEESGVYLDLIQENDQLLPISQTRKVIKKLIGLLVYHSTFLIVCDMK